MREYLRYHAPRYAALVGAITATVPLAERVLDVGPSFQTVLLRSELPDAHVDSLGFDDPRFPPRPGERHLEADLNAAREPERLPPLRGYDLIVMAEVLEHLHAPPGRVLGYLGGGLRRGGRVLIQTPNAVALHKRLRALAGRSPFEPIRESTTNPGHFHEYTLGELREAARRAGLEPAGWWTANHFRAGGPAGRLYRRLSPALPPSLRHGITMWLERR